MGSEVTIDKNEWYCEQDVNKRKRVQETKITKYFKLIS